MDLDTLNSHAERLLDAGRAHGADHVEVAGEWATGAVVDFEKNDINVASSDDEATFGVRVMSEGRVGFATTNDPKQLEATLADAVAIARVSVADPNNELPLPRPITPVEGLHDPAVGATGVDVVTGMAAGLLSRAKEHDARVSIDSGRVSAAYVNRIIASTRGVRAAESTSSMSCGLFGMAVDGDSVGSFIAESHASRHREGFDALLDRCARRFAEKAIGALDPRPTESFKGAVLFTPEAAASLLIGNLLQMAGASSMRKEKSPLCGRLGEAIASPKLTILDASTTPGMIGSTSFDREGMPRAPLPFVEKGVFAGVAYDHYEARCAGLSESTGHASGGASMRPTASFGRLEIEAGDRSLEDIVRDVGKTILVTRFSGSTDNVTGRFSGVVKAGFLLDGGERIPIAETLIAGNILDALRDIAAVSSDTETFGGGSPVPYFLVDGISVTAG